MTEKERKQFVEFIINNVLTLIFDKINANKIDIINPISASYNVA